MTKGDGTETTVPDWRNLLACPDTGVRLCMLTILLT